MEDNKNNFFGRMIAAGSHLFGSKNLPAPVRIPVPGESLDQLEAFVGNGVPLFTVSYDGEKNLGEIGPIMNYKPDYAALSYRSWQALYESEVAQTVLNKFKIWVIGSGLKLQADPVKRVLKTEGIEIKTEEFNEVVEALFRVYAGSKKASYSSMMNLHKGADTAYKNAIVGGDVLVVLRYVNDQWKYQLIDGIHVKSPMIGDKFLSEVKSRGNIIRNGIELSPTGEHVAYYVQKDTALFQFERIPARGAESGMLMAYLVYGMEYRMDNHRGMPLIAVVLETIKKLERYKEATVGSAEERQKIAFSIEHDHHSDGENPMQKNLAKAYDWDRTGKSDIPVTIEGKKLADTVSASTNKEAWNLPIGSTMKMLESKNELYFKDFYTINIHMVCAAIGIPPEVALSKYDSNYSASRAAIKDWENTLNVKRADFAMQFYQPIYNNWLLTEVLKNKIQAPGYLKAFMGKNEMILEAYQTARFVGVGVPHIDPLKEVKAEREKLGELGKNLPLTTLEAATEALGGGDSDSNVHQFVEELNEAKELGLEEEKEEVVAPVAAPVKPAKPVKKSVNKKAKKV